MRKVASVVVAGLCASGCGSTAAVTTRVAIPHVSVLAGWRTYAYARAKISVPADWTLATPRGCADRSARGVLVLGAPKSLVNCPVGVNSIVVASLSPGATQALGACPAVDVNGFEAHVLPCRNSDATGIVQYLVPALGIEAVGSGTSGENVSGTGTNTVVGEILHTLR